MEFTILDWMVIIGAGVILLVLVDAMKRIYRERRNGISLNVRINRFAEEEQDDDFSLLSELPNGGARVVSKNSLTPSTSVMPGKLDPESDDRSELAKLDDNASPASKFSHLELPTDTFDEKHAQKNTDGQIDGNTLESVEKTAFHQTSDREDSLCPRRDDSTDMPSFSALESEELSVLPPAASKTREIANKAEVQFQSSSNAALEDSGLLPSRLDWLERLDNLAPEESEKEAELPRNVEPYVLVLNVVTRSEEGFSGSDIMHVLLACGLRFGDMDFFHRHEQGNGRGAIQFSVCNMVKPGVFDIDNMDKLNTKGLMFFVTLPGPKDMSKAFDYMYEAAKSVASHLDGDVLDETRSVITRQSIEHMRQKIREFKRRLAAKHYHQSKNE